MVVCSTRRRKTPKEKVAVLDVQEYILKIYFQEFPKRKHLKQSLCFMFSAHKTPKNCAMETQQLSLCIQMLPGERRRGCPGSEVTLPPHPAWPFWSRAPLERTKRGGQVHERVDRYSGVFRSRAVRQWVLFFFSLLALTNVPFSYYRQMDGNSPVFAS